MAKAINWPLEFREEVLAEDGEHLRCAFRLGALYYDNRYWTPGEEVDIRVNHLRVRRATVQGDLKCCSIKALSAEDFSMQKSGLKSVDAVVSYLSRVYGEPVDEDTLVTVVYYKNQPVDPDAMEVPDDLHMG